MTDPIIHLSDYTPPSYLVDSVALEFKLHPTKTTVTSKIKFSANPEAKTHALRLDGEAMTLKYAKINGETVELNPDKTGIDLPEHLLGKGFEWECEVEINPEANTSLDGLYISNGMYCTQCEAEGFRRITYYLDRPDVMTTFSVRIHSDEPVRLSNGNEVARGEGWVEWHDPWPKPSYLFALVAGDLVAHSDSFTTMSGRNVALNIWVREGDEGKCSYAMDSLKRSMKWDEKTYGREYDLDLFNIVAVSDFNMGAMENKGLNVFNASLVLASPETATDADFERIESVIAHEYFHNWTGNRITCRDWFQLCLKEGLTVYRDQHFTSDMRDPAVKRIEDVVALRGRQFSEDAGPLSHPPRPNQYVEINNFYTATIYEKGAEVVGMLRTLVGANNYRKALDLYFERHDGQACTIEDWIKVFEDVTGRDLSQFSLWYTSAGTPRVAASSTFDGNTYTLTLRQSTPPTPNELEKAPRHIPVAVGLLYPDGTEAVATKVLELTKAEQDFTFSGLQMPPIASVLRGFSAPVVLEQKLDNSLRAYLLAHDTDPFNRWQAGRDYALDILADLPANPAHVAAEFLSAMERMAVDDKLAPAFRAITLTLPAEGEVARKIAANGGVPDPIAIHKARRVLDIALAQKMTGTLPELYMEMAVAGPYFPDAIAAGKRSLRTRVLALLTAIEPDAASAAAQFAQADNMTEQLPALGLLIQKGQGAAALQSFYEQWQHQPLVLDKWFGVQAGRSAPDQAVNVVTSLMSHKDFNWKNPNRFRALIGTFAMGNIAGFHEKNGAGYKLVADWLIRLDPINPQITARMTTVFESWRLYDQPRQEQMRAALTRLLALETLSKNTREIASRILG
ncbi:MAG: aminopeptidase N [Rhodobacteraceae bacterium]|nr:aminopeptidase N [Paracoccaceae bacterium]